MQTPPAEHKNSTQNVEDTNDIKTLDETHTENTQTLNETVEHITIEVIHFFLNELSKLMKRVEHFYTALL